MEGALPNIDMAELWTDRNGWEFGPADRRQKLPMAEMNERRKLGRRYDAPSVALWIPPDLAAN